MNNTDEAQEALRRMMWLCNELQHGNGFSADNYRNWHDMVRRALLSLEDNAGDPSPALIRAAKAQWAREAKEKKGE